jgi:hypothetical protein
VHEARDAPGPYPLDRAPMSRRTRVLAMLVGRIQVGEMGLADLARWELEDRLDRYVALRGGEPSALIGKTELSDRQSTVRSGHVSVLLR